MMSLDFLILIFFFLIGAIGCFSILKNNFQQYKKILPIHVFLSIFACLFFYLNGFYRFTLPLLYIIPTVVVTFGLLVLFTLHFQQRHHTFSYLFMIINWVFVFEIFLEFIGFIQFRNGWDFWDSYSFYWIYIRLFLYFGNCYIPMEKRYKINIPYKIYWICFGLTCLLSLVVAFYLIHFY